MQDQIQLIGQFVADSVRVKTEFFRDNGPRIAETANRIAQALRQGGKVLFYGNGGSAADAQHMAAELVGRFVPDRRPLAALSLSTDTSVLTSLSNDYGFNEVFARQIQGLGKSGDVAVAISTSGNSPNVLAGVDACRALGIYTIGFSGETGGKMVDRCDVLFRVPSRRTPRIQETHILLGHILCELVDRTLFPDAYPKD